MSLVAVDEFPLGFSRLGAGHRGNMLNVLPRDLRLWASLIATT